MKENKKVFELIALWTLIAIIGRVIPHIPNFTPFTTLGVFSAMALSRRSAVLITLGAAFASDVVVSYLVNCQTLGSWSFFTYSAWLAIALYAPKEGMGFPRLMMTTLGASFAFWLWTNFGSWVESGMYTKDFSGLMSCYIMGIPFLAYDLMGALVWTSVLSALGLRFGIVSRFSSLVNEKFAQNSEK